MAEEEKGQKFADYKLWDEAFPNWWQAARWTVDPNEPNFFWGGWRGDVRDMQQRVAPGLLALAGHWQKMGDELDNKLQVVRSTRAQLQDNRGAAQTVLDTKLDETEKSILRRRENIRGLPQALRDDAQTINEGAALFLGPLDAKFQQVLAAKPQCLQLALEAQPTVQRMALAMLHAGDVQQKALRFESEPPKAEFEPIPRAAIPDGGATAIQVGAMPAEAGSAAQAVATTPGGNGAGVVVAPAAGTPTAVGAPVVESAGGQGVLLAGTGAGTLAPPMPTPAATPAGGATMVAPGALASFGPGVVPAVGRVAAGTAGVMPFAPLGDANAATSQRTSNRGTAPDADTGRTPASTNPSGANAPPMPIIPPAGAGALGARAAATIRPGVATRAGGVAAVRAGGSVEATTTGVPAGLLGRAAQADPTATRSPGVLHRRAGSTRRRQEDATIVEFLDEDAWQAEDPGSGLVAVDEPPPVGAIVGPQLLGSTAGRG